MALSAEAGGLQMMPVPYDHWGAAGTRDLGAQNSGGGAPSHLDWHDGEGRGRIMGSGAGAASFHTASGYSSIVMYRVP